MVNRDLVSSALQAPYAVISTIGPHAGETVENILRRKSHDIKAAGRTFWLVRSNKATPENVQALCQRSGTAYALFIERATATTLQATASIDGTRESVKARKYSPTPLTNPTWRPFPPGIGDVTGNITRITCALVIDQLEMVQRTREIDLWAYRDFEDPDRSIIFNQGSSTFCAVKSNLSNHPAGMKSRYRSVVAVARLTEPFGVWVSSSQ